MATQTPIRLKPSTPRKHAAPFGLSTLHFQLDLHPLNIGAAFGLLGLTIPFARGEIGEYDVTCIFEAETAVDYRQLQPVLRSATSDRWLMPLRELAEDGNIQIPNKFGLIVVILSDANVKQAVPRTSRGGLIARVSMTGREFADFLIL